MNKTYQPFIIKMSNDIVERIEVETSFFTEENIKSKDFAVESLCELLTEKFLSGEISSDEEDLVSLLTETEFGKLLHMISIQNALEGLLEKGLINSFENDGEEHYFLTETGKDKAKKMKENGEE
jgi:hypothetical protein